MARQIIYSKKSLKQIEDVAVYLEENFSFTAAQNFLKKVVVLEPKMTNHPETGRPTSVNPGIRYFHIDDHRILFYRYNNKVVKVLTIFDTRQDPAKRPH